MQSIPISINQKKNFGQHCCTSKERSDSFLLEASAATFVSASSLPYGFSPISSGRLRRMKKAAGRAITSTIRAMIWYVCLQPYFSSNIVTIGLKIVPPTPIPAIAILIARPRFLANQFVIIILTGISAEFNQNTPMNTEEIYR